MRHSLLKGISAQIVSAAVSIFVLFPQVYNLQWHNEAGMEHKTKHSTLAWGLRKTESGFHGFCVIIFDSHKT